MHLKSFKYLAFAVCSLVLSSQMFADGEPDEALTENVEFLEDELVAKVDNPKGNAVRPAAKKNVGSAMRTKSTLAANTSKSSDDNSENWQDYPDAFVVVDYLYWLTDFNLPFSAIFSSMGENGAFIDVLRTKDHFSSGWRVGLGWNTHYDHWDLVGTWTYYRNTSSGNASHVLNNDSLSARSKLSLNFNTADLELGANHWVSERLAFRPFCGVRGAWLYQFSSANYLDSSDGSSALVRVKQPAYGVGPRIGLNTSWCATPEFSVIANISGTMAWGWGRTKVTAHLPGNNNSGGGGGGVLSGIGNVAHAKDRLHQLLPSFQSILGFSWGRMWSQNKYSFRISAGWESQYWVAAPILIFGGSVSFQGITTEAVFGF
jgi:hypothetical protein